MAQLSVRAQHAAPLHATERTSFIIPFVGQFGYSFRVLTVRENEYRPQRRLP
jgi:hypothetical protein